MGMFDVFKKNKGELTDEQKKWNRMWELWEKGQVPSPYTELMTYQSEINNGGHDQYFFNVGNTGDLPKEVAVLDTVLPVKLKRNLETAYKAYLTVNENDGKEESQKIMEQCDRVFYENEKELDRLLKAYAATIPR